ncbi:MAG: TAXI family TRAP transporter solute-binding subunit [Marivibrio sp.]|uniref:TAXI family TRAP transporter solute-binding subunit n=1 Tax=Marivibrio sp. TaxID=2039719 RepID=UPI0032EB3E1B
MIGRKPSLFATIAAAAALAVTAGAAQAETRITYKSAKSTSSYYQMAVQVAEAVQKATDRALSVTVEESQGSVQNVKEAAVREGAYVFTTPPVLIKLAKGNTKMFEDGQDYGDIRALFPIPSLTMHYVVRADADVESFQDLTGKDFIIGKGSFGAREAAKNFEQFGAEPDLVDVELNAAVPALKNGQVAGFATAGSYPAPNVVEAAAGTDIKLLSMSEEQVETTGRTRLVIPAGTYPGVERDTVTTSLPVGAYTTTAMDEETAYQLTKAYWESKPKMAETARWWAGVSPEMLAMMAGPLHPGALRYYEEAGTPVADGLK